MGTTYTIDLNGNSNGSSSESSVSSSFNFTADDMLIVTDFSGGLKNIKETSVDIDEVVQLDEIQTITNKTIAGGNY